jgi:hypothetical protein
MKKTINIPKINIIKVKKREKNNFKGYPIYTPTEDINNEIQNKLILIQRIFQNKKNNLKR